VDASKKHITKLNDLQEKCEHNIQCQISQVENLEGIVQSKDAQILKMTEELKFQ